MTSIDSNPTTAAAKAKKAAATVLRQHNNENAAKFLALGMAGIMILFIISHWIHISYKYYGARRHRGAAALRYPIALTRSAFTDIFLLEDNTYI
jgi:hypothetical protein